MHICENDNVVVERGRDMNLTLFNVSTNSFSGFCSRNYIEHNLVVEGELKSKVSMNIKKLNEFFALRTNNHNFSISFDDFAFITHWFNRCSDFVQKASKEGFDVIKLQSGQENVNAEIRKFLKEKESLSIV